MIDHLFAHDFIETVIAHTLAVESASNAVLKKKVGMKFMEEIEDPEEGAVWRWAISRNAY
ncbi:MAG: hypothetical protein R3211_08660 [Balneolaceae bacterium]|nr:hypothetical protein [Balneolaceae bacterium]